MYAETQQPPAEQACPLLPKLFYFGRHTNSSAHLRYSRVHSPRSCSSVFRMTCIEETKNVVTSKKRCQNQCHRRRPNPDQRGLVAVLCASAINHALDKNVAACLLLSKSVRSGAAHTFAGHFVWENAHPDAFHLDVSQAATSNHLLHHTCAHPPPDRQCRQQREGNVTKNALAGRLVEGRLLRCGRGCASLATRTQKTTQSSAACDQSQMQVS